VISALPERDDRGFTLVEVIVSLAILALVREGDRISKRDSVGSWLYKVAYRVARKAQVRLARRAAHESSAPYEPAAEPGPDLDE